MFENFITNSLNEAIVYSIIYIILISFLSNFFALHQRTKSVKPEPRLPRIIDYIIMAMTVINIVYHGVYYNFNKPAYGLIAIIFVYLNILCAWTAFH